MSDLTRASSYWPVCADKAGIMFDGARAVCTECTLFAENDGIAIIEIL